LNFRQIYNLHPVLFGIFFVLSLFAFNIDLVLLHGYSELFSLIFAVGALAFLLWLALSFLLKNKQKAGFLASFSLIMVFFYGHISFVLDFLIVDELYFFGLWIGIFAAGFYGILKIKIESKNITTILFVVSITLVILPLFDVFEYYQSLSNYEHLSKRGEPIKIPKTFAANQPNIYYLIFDRYPSSKILKNIYDFDNSAFLSYLEEKGFYIATESKANYPFTFQSMASSRNMEYINYLSEIAGDSNNRAITYQLNWYCKVCKFLNSNGYKSLNPGSFYQPNQTKLDTDELDDMGAFRLPDFTATLYETTIFANAMNLYTGITPIDEQDREDFRREKYEIASAKLKFLENIPQGKNPFLIYGNILLPHKPYVFDAEGGYVSLKESQKISPKEQFRNQLSFVNNKIIHLIDKILLDSENEPIIILQSDEGPYPYRVEATRAQGDFDFSTMTIEELEQKNSILNAYYLPNVPKDVLYPSITPVNTFRVIFNQYFDEDLELLPDHYYVYRDISNYYDFVNVTDKVLNQSYLNIDFEKDHSSKFDWEQINLDQNNSAKFTYISELLNIYYQRQDLQEAFPEVNDGDFQHLLGWAGEFGLSVYPHLSKYDYIYEMLAIYDRL